TRLIAVRSSKTERAPRPKAEAAVLLGCEGWGRFSDRCCGRSLGVLMTIMPVTSCCARRPSTAGVFVCGGLRWSSDAPLANTVVELLHHNQVCFFIVNNNEYNLDCAEMHPWDHCPRKRAIQ